MKQQWSDRSARRESLQVAGLESVLDDLRAGPPPSTGEWLARLVRRIRPSRRALGKLLPPAIDSEYLRDLVDEVFSLPRDHVWIAAVPRDDWEALLRVIDVYGADPAAADDGHLEVLLDQCDGYVAAIRKRSREAGVGVNLVFLLARIEQVTGRLRRLRDLIAPVQPAASDAAVSAGRSTASRHDHVLDFFVQIVRQENRRNSMRDLMSGTTELLARRVTERSPPSSPG